MGLLALNRVMSIQQDRRHRQIQSRDYNCSTAVVARRRKGKPRQQDDNPRGRKRMRRSVPELPKDIWIDILSRLPLQDASRAGCVSRIFLSASRCHPNLTFTEGTLGLNGKVRGRDKRTRIFTNRVDNIMRKHSGAGVKTFTLCNWGSPIDASYLNRWLKIAVTPGIEELVLSVFITSGMYYNLSCPLLFNGSGNSIRHLNLSWCDFHPRTGLGCLTRLHLSQVQITGDELGQLLSNSLAMEELELVNCHKIISLKIPCLLHRLNCLTVFWCIGLQVIENEAPNVCVVDVDGTLLEKLRVGDLLQVKELKMFDETNLLHRARSKLPFIMPNLETLNLYSADEKVSTPLSAVKFLHLRNLEILLEEGDRRGFSYDYFSLVYFLDACPILEDFVLCVSQTRVRQNLISVEDSHLRQMPEYHHSNLKNVKILGFCSAKSMVELTYHILENATSLECLTLDAIYDRSSRSGAVRSCLHNKFGECRRVIGRTMMAHAHMGLSAIGRYVVEKVPSTVKLNVKKLCDHCHPMSHYLAFA
ncbi:unnamed protein product [Alopecurus aequalis]